jgi:hypothetical protein
MLKQIIKLFISFLITSSLTISSFAATVFKIQCELQGDRGGLGAEFTGVFPVTLDNKKETKVIGYIDNLILYEDGANKKEVTFPYNKNNIAVEGDVSYEAQGNIFTLKLSRDTELQIDTISINIDPQETSQILTSTGQIYYSVCYFTDTIKSRI